MPNDSNSSVIIVGIVRDIEKSIERDLERFKNAFSRFKNIDFYVVESGSKDNSVKKLQKLSNERDDFSFKRLEIDQSMNRTFNMAAARNAYLEHLRKDSRFLKYEYVVVADFNNLNNKLDSYSVNSCWDDHNWDAVTANQSGRYYDIWALRHPLWSPNDCWEAANFYRKYIKFPELALAYTIRARSFRIPKDTEWIEVESAFGGLAIYKSGVFKWPAIYEGISSNGKAICEHVLFNEQIREQGAKIYINPKLINARITDHSRRLSMLFTLLRISRYPFKYFMRTKY